MYEEGDAMTSELEQEIITKAADITARITKLLDQHAEWVASESGVPREIVAEAAVALGVKWALAHGAKGARAEWLRQQLAASPPPAPTVN